MAFTSTAAAVAAADAVEDMDLARLDHMPVVALEHDGAPVVAVGVVDLAEGGGEHLSSGILCADTADHLLEAVDLGSDVFASGLRALDAETKLEVFLIADQDVRKGANLAKNSPELLLATNPERRPVVEVETDRGAIFLGFASYLKAEPAGVRTQGGDKAGKMDYLDTFLPEYPIKIEILDIQCPADFPGTIIPDSRAAGAVAAVGHIDLVTIPPRTALGNLRPLEIHPAGA